jgi:hypothetical protein
LIAGYSRVRTRAIEIEHTHTHTHTLQDVFPGSQPVSLNRANLNNLRQEPYMVCEKTDGTRYLLLARPDGAFFIDRKNSVRRLPPLAFPLPDDPRGSHLNTLMDGELVVDIIEQPDGCSAKLYIYYMVYIYFFSHLHRSLHIMGVLLTRNRLLHETGRPFPLPPSPNHPAGPSSGGTPFSCTISFRSTGR